jgi:hypothetical protein
MEKKQIILNEKVRSGKSSYISIIIKDIEKKLNEEKKQNEKL